MLHHTSRQSLLHLILFYLTMSDVIMEDDHQNGGYLSINYAVILKKANSASHFTEPTRYITEFTSQSLVRLGTH